MIVDQLYIYIYISIAKIAIQKTGIGIISRRTFGFTPLTYLTFPAVFSNIIKISGQ